MRFIFTKSLNSISFIFSRKYREKKISSKCSVNLPTHTDTHTHACILIKVLQNHPYNSSRSNKIQSNNGFDFISTTWISVSRVDAIVRHLFVTGLWVYIFFTFTYSICDYQFVFLKNQISCNAGGYDELDPLGNITIRWDVVSENDDGSRDVSII